MKPLYGLLKKDSKWNWDRACETSFENIKKAVRMNRSLAHYNPNYPIRLTVDGSGQGLGAVLSQRYDNEEHPLAFSSRTLTKAEENYAQIEREAAALIFGVKKFHLYLYGRKWILVNDNRPLLAIFGPKKGILSNYSYDVEWVPSNKNIADWLSRAPIPHTKSENDDLDPALHYIFEDNVDLPLIKVANYVRSGWPQNTVENDLQPYFKRREELHVEKDILLWGYRVIVPSTLQKRVLRDLHASHMGICKTKSLARSYVWWPQIEDEIEDAIKNCAPCNANKDNPPKSTLIPWEWPTTPWRRIHIDYLGPIAGRYFLVLVDSHSKWPSAFQTRSMSASTTITILRREFANFGIPDILVSDNYSSFSSDEFQSFLSKNGVKFRSGAAFFPKSNGAAENSVKTVKRALKVAISEASPEKLELALQQFLLDYRNTPHATTGISPAQALIGRNLRNRFDLLRPPATADRVQDKQRKQIENYGGDQPTAVLPPDNSIWVRNYRKREEKWVKATIVKTLGPRRLSVFVPHLNLTWIRHKDQTRNSSEIPNDIQATDRVLIDAEDEGSSIPTNTSGVEQRRDAPPAPDHQSDAAAPATQLRRSARDRRHPPRRLIEL